jgi:predicted AlkP superfamily pyrophosphatase or phosphodiesterase
MYETLHTGLMSSEHGIVSNSMARCSSRPNVFDLASRAGLVTAAAAYFWFSELYNRAPYHRTDHREVDDATLAIQHGRFYTEDDTPDLEVFAAAGTLVRRHKPHYLLVHPMGMDYTGEAFGSDSREYRNHAIRQDAWLTPFLAEWMEMGYAILFTSDHGMSPDASHGGTAPGVREVPLYWIQPKVQGLGDTGQTVSQLRIAPTLCQLLGLPIPVTMKHPPIA